MSAPTANSLPVLPNFDRVEASYAGYRNVRALLGTVDAITPQMLSVQLIDIIKLMVGRADHFPDIASLLTPPL